MLHTAPVALNAADFVPADFLSADFNPAELASPVSAALDGILLTPTAPVDMDLGFVLTCAALVFLMQAGFCMLESGMIRAKNSINVAVKNLLDSAISMLVYAAVGFSIMFGASQSGLYGTHVEYWTNNELNAFFLFQVVFCGTASTIVSGAIAERTKLITYLFTVLLLSGLTYPLIGHWCWGGALGNTGTGWLADLGFVDWAGATVVHVVGGFASLAAVIAIGPRRGYRQHQLRGGHSLTLAIMGCFLLWFGWWGFNGGSGLSANESISIVLFNTNLGAVSGMLAAAGWSWVRTGKTDVVDLISGTLAGLVSVTAACHVIAPIPAIVAGTVGALIALVAIEELRKRNIDDVVGAFGVHGAAGIWGTLCVAFFAPMDSLPAATREMQVMVQSLGVFVAATVSFGMTYVALRVMKRFTALRVKAGEERLGLNVVEHGATNEVTDLLSSMNQHRVTGEFDTHLAIDTDTEVGQIALEYNAVLGRVQEEMTGREQTNRNLRSEKLRLQSVLDNAGVGIYQLDADGHFQSANTKLLEIFGYSSASQLIDQGDPFSIPWHRSSREIQDRLMKQFRSGKAIKDLESQWTSVSGETRWLLESIVPVRDENGLLLTWLGTVHDVTAGKKSLLAEVEIAEAKSKAKGDFLANMSHEIRTPLNGVIGMLDLLSTSKLDRKEENYVNVARSSAETLLAQINDILDFSKIEAGKFELSPVDFDLRELMESTAEQFAIRVHMKGLEMNCQLARDLPYTVSGDPERLRQIIVNLMGNAIKFTETGEINLVVTPRGHVVRFAVQDTGIGIPEDAKEKLFDSFVQADASTTRRYGGTGLGLSIANQLVEKMGGKLKVDSEVGVGSEFWFELPLPVIEQQVPQDADKAQLMSGLTEFSVLIVDDNTTNCEILQNQLANWGLRSSVCNVSTAAVQKMLVAQQLQKPFDLLILDFCMPEMNGRDVAAQIQQHPSLRELPIVMLSSNYDLMSQRELSEVGIDVAMTKPARQSRLFDTIVSLLYKQKPAAIDDRRRPVNESMPPIVSDQGVVSNRVNDVVPNVALTAESNTASNAASTFMTQPSLSADVLIAEDNVVNQMVVQQMLEQLGYTCEVAGNGQVAWERLQQGRYGMVLMDGHMPVMDGLTATKKIRHWERENQVAPTPIVALTANVINGVREECLEAGMNDYLCKPITLERLKETSLRFVGPPQLRPEVSPASEPIRPMSFEQAPLHPAPIQQAPIQQVPVSSHPVEFPVPQPPLPTPDPSLLPLASAIAMVTEREPTAMDHSSPMMFSPPADTDTRAWIDQPALLARCGGDETFQTQILSIMRDTLPERISDLREAGGQNDWQRVRMIAHQLRGAAGDTSLIAVQDAAGNLEQLIHDGAASEVPSAMSDLEQRILHTLQQLQETLAAAGS